MKYLLIVGFLSVVGFAGCLTTNRRAAPPPTPSFDEVKKAVIENLDQQGFVNAVAKMQAELETKIETEIVGIKTELTQINDPWPMRIFMGAVSGFMLTYSFRRRYKTIEKVFHPEECKTVAGAK